MNFQPQTTPEAMTTVKALTDICDMTLRQVRAATTDRARSVTIARFQELNEVRMRIITRFGLEEWATGLVG